MSESSTNDAEALPPPDWPANLVHLPPLGHTRTTFPDAEISPNQPITALTAKIAHDEDTWTSERAQKLEHLFDEMAPSWDSQWANNHDGRMAPVWDAIERGGDITLGSIADIGAGTGSSSVFLSERFQHVFAFDLSLEMLRHGPQTLPRVQADASRLPIATASLDAVLLMNAFVFPSEIDRVLAPHGVLICVSSLGEATPIYLPPQQLIGVMPGDWQGVCSGVGPAMWVTLRRTIK